MATLSADVALEQAYREHWVRLLALLTRELRSLDLAEEALGEAFAEAAAQWPLRGVPANPAGWLRTTARRRATDRQRRDQVLRRKLPLLVVDEVAPGPEEPSEMTSLVDDRLRLLFTACHPALAMETRLALTLRYVGGLRTPEVARLLLTFEPTMAARLTRAKAKIARAGIPYVVPTDAELPERLDGVLAVVYLLFTEGYTATDGLSLTRDDLAAEAIRLTRLLVELMPDEPEVRALLGLLRLQHARRDARSEDGRLVLLADQDRSRWHAEEIDLGLTDVRRAARAADPPGPYALQALIAAAHASAATADDTDWATIARLYADLEARTASPVVRLNRAVAVAEHEGPEAGLALLDGLAEELPTHPMVPAVEAELLCRLGRHNEAVPAYDRALALTTNVVRADFLRTRRAAAATRAGG